MNEREIYGTYRTWLGFFVKKLYGTKQPPLEVCGGGGQEPQFKDSYAKYTFMLLAWCFISEVKYTPFFILPKTQWG